MSDSGNGRAKEIQQRSTNVWGETMKKFFLLGLCTNIFAGCALLNHTMVDPYKSGTGQRTAADVKKIAWMPLDVTPTLRDEPRAVGVKKNSFGMETAYIFVAPDPQQWLADGAKVEFDRVGLLSDDAESDAPHIAVHAEQFFGEPAVGFFGADLVAVTVLDVTVTLPRQDKAFERRFVGEEASFVLAWTDALYDEKLLKSARMALREAAVETRALVDREAM